MKAQRKSCSDRSSTLSVFLMAALMLALTASGCSSHKSLRRVSEQNYQNISDLSQNAALSVSLNKKYFAEIADAILLLRIETVSDEISKIVGRASGSGPASGQTWDQSFQPHADLLARRQEVVSVLNQNPDETRKKDLKRRHGWIYVTVEKSQSFTPQKAHQVLKLLYDLKTQYSSDSQTEKFLTEARLLLRPYDPTLAYNEEQIAAAKVVLDKLDEELSKQIRFAQGYGQAMLSYAEADVGLAETVTGVMGDEEVSTLLGQLAEEHIDDPGVREAALNLLTTIPELVSPQ